ncbi:MAG: SpoIIE family protein phosphatase [Treponema sp.]|nr:SpoIIE family protein phosphatase [Treponema sp.]
MKAKSSLLFLCILSALLLSSCAGKEESEKIYLSDGWRYCVNEDSAKSGDYSYFDNSKLANLEGLLPEKRGFIWLKKTFTLPDSLRGQPLGLYLGRITLADQTYINGSYIGGEGSFPPHEFSAWNTARFYIIPAELLGEGENVLTIKIWVDGEGSIVSNPFISDVTSAKKAAGHEALWNSKIHLIFAFMMIIIGGYHLMLYLKNKRERENLLFALINLLSALYLSVFYYGELPDSFENLFSFLIFQKIFSSALPFVFPYLVASFVLSFVHAKENKIIRRIRLGFMLLPIVIIMCAPNYLVLRSMRWTQILLVPPLFYIFFILIRSVFAKNKDARTLLFGFSPLVVTVILDLLIHNVLKLYNFPYITSLGWQLVIITLLFIMANRFANSRAQVEDLNKNLEKKVAERTAELSESNSRLSDANNQLELTNNQLIEAKEKADRDMKLAVYVQNCFFNTTLPRFKNWEVAFKFKPAAGVSGDLYDFFYEGDKLQGLGLFDVSGHGIASGLVTMLAKTVIDRKFRECAELPFPKAMEEINKQIIEEKGDIENYLTGVLLRINDSKVEFISAGHPKVFLRTAKNGKVYPVELKDGSGNGGIIGFSGAVQEFKAVGFSMQKGDSLILYTDCLNESKNEEGQQFGEERIAQAFADSGIGTARNRMDYVLERFNTFTGNKALNDDLTVIVLQYNP